MIIGTIKEKKKFENRVAISPDEVKNYVKAGHQVFIEKNAGLASGFTDKSYKEAGATISSLKEILKTFLIIVFGLSVIALTVRAVSFLDLIVDNGYSISNYFKYSILNLFDLYISDILFLAA